MTPHDWPEARALRTHRLTLEPLRVDHAEALAAALDDPGLHEFIGGSPATADELRSRYGFQVVGRSPDGSEGWLNWVIRRRDTGDAVGTVQATLRRTGPAVSADVASVVASPHQGRGLASEASAAMVAWLRDQGVEQVVALIHPDHTASAGVAGISAWPRPTTWSTARSDGSRPPRQRLDRPLTGLGRAASTITSKARSGRTRRAPTIVPGAATDGVARLGPVGRRRLDDLPRHDVRAAGASSAGRPSPSARGPSPPGPRTPYRG